MVAPNNVGTESHEDGLIERPTYRYEVGKVYLKDIEHKQGFISIFTRKKQDMIRRSDDNTLPTEKDYCNASIITYLRSRYYLR